LGWAKKTQTEESFAHWVHSRKPPQKLWKGHEEVTRNPRTIGTNAKGVPKAKKIRKWGERNLGCKHTNSNKRILHKRKKKKVGGGHSARESAKGDAHLKRQ